jgi:hypothetical protein
MDRSVTKRPAGTDIAGNGDLIARPRLLIVTAMIAVA